MPRSIWYLFSLLLLLAGCTSPRLLSPVDFPVKVYKLGTGTYLHTTYLQTESFGRVPCNGMIVVNQKEAIVVDATVNDSTAKVLIDWLETKLKCKVIGVVATHFHIDCLGGLEAFHQRGIPSYALDQTISLANEAGLAVPQNSFSEQLDLPIGKKTLQLIYPGPGHTRDNIVAYYPADRVLFGGCLVKAMGAGIGYTGDADVPAWPRTAQKLKDQIPDCKQVIPGHGKVGGLELLDFTAELFSQEGGNID